MTVKTRAKIVDFIPKRLQQKYKSLYHQHFRDICDNYNQVMATYSLRRILKRPESEIEVGKFAFRQKGRTENFDQFLANRRRIEAKLLITQPFIRFIQGSSQMEFPQLLFDFAEHRNSVLETNKPSNLIKLEALLRKELDEKAFILRSQWYPKAIAVLLKHYKRHAVAKYDWRRCLKCAELLINRQLIAVKMRTFDRMLFVLQQPSLAPCVTYEIGCNDDVCILTPNVEHVLRIYSNIVDRVLDIGSDFICLEAQIDNSYFQSEKTYLNAQVSPVIRQEMIDRLGRTLKMIYEPIFEHVRQFEARFHSVLSHENHAELEAFCATPQTNDAYLLRIAELRGQLCHAHGIVQREFFDNASVLQTKFTKFMADKLTRAIEQVTHEIVKKHRGECQKLGDWLDAFEGRALERMTSTEMLLANGDYMVHVKQVELELIGDDVQNILKVMVELGHVMRYF